MSKIIITFIILTITIITAHCYAEIVDKENNKKDNYLLQLWKQCLINKVEAEHADANCSGECSDRVKYERIDCIKQYKYMNYQPEILQFSKNGEC